MASPSPRAGSQIPQPLAKMMAESHAGVPVLWPFLASRSHQASPCAERPSQHSGNFPELHVVHGEQPGTLPPPSTPPAFSLALGWSLQQLMTRVVPALSSTIGYAQQHLPRHRIRTSCTQHHPPACPKSSAQSPEPAWASSSLLCPRASTQHTAPVPWLAPAALSAAVLPPPSLHPSQAPPSLLVPWSCTAPISSALQGCNWWH